MRRSPAGVTWSPRGSCTRIPLMVSSAFNFFTMWTISSTVDSIGTAMCLNLIPTSWAAFDFMRTYTEESGRSPAWTMANWGWKRGYITWVDLIRWVTSWRMDLIRLRSIKEVNMNNERTLLGQCHLWLRREDLGERSLLNEDEFEIIGCDQPQTFENGRPQCRTIAADSIYFKK